MKVIIINEEIISLENVRRVSKHVSERSYTSYGKKCIDYTYSLYIYYGHFKEHDYIECGKNEKGKEICDATLCEIYNILSGE
jgi:hypothetical protein